MEILGIKNGSNNCLQNKCFIIKSEKEKYSLEISINKEYIFFIVKKINNSLDFYFQKKIKMEEILSKLKLTHLHFNNGLFFKKLNELNQENKIIIDEIDEDNINIKFEDSNIKFETTLFKKDMTIDDKLNILYNEIKLRQDKNNYKSYIIDNQIKLEFIKESEYNSNNLKKEEKKFYKKIEKMFEEQKKLLDNMIKEFNEIKHIFLEKNYNSQVNSSENTNKKNKDYDNKDKVGTNFIKSNIDNLKKKENNQENSNDNNKNIYNIKFNNNDANNNINNEKINDIIIRYKINKEDSRVYLFDSTFLDNNKKKCKIVYKNKKCKCSSSLALIIYIKMILIFMIGIKVIWILKLKVSIILLI